MSEELKPCPNPWCKKSRAELCLAGIRGGFFIQCDSCKVHSPAAAQKPVAIANWNTRAESPDLTAAKQQIEELTRELENARTVQAQFSAERAKALEELAFQKRRFERSLEAAKETWATHEKQFAEQQEKLEAANVRVAELEVELFIRTKEKLGKALSRIAELEKDRERNAPIIRDVLNDRDSLVARNNELMAEAARLREVLVKIRADYDHPWPIEDASTRTYRLGVIAAIDAAMSERDGK